MMICLLKVDLLITSSTCRYFISWTKLILFSLKLNTFECIAVSSCTTRLRRCSWTMPSGGRYILPSSILYRCSCARCRRYFVSANDTYFDVTTDLLIGMNNLYNLYAGCHVYTVLCPILKYICSMLFLPFNKGSTHQKSKFWDIRRSSYQCRDESPHIQDGCSRPTT